MTFPTRDDSGPARPPASVYGAAPERTALAWQRSGLGVTVGCFMAFYSSIRLTVIPIAMAALVLGLVTAGLALAFPGRRYLRGDPADSYRLLASISGAVVALAALGTTVGVLNLFSSRPW